MPRMSRLDSDDFVSPNPFKSSPHWVLLKKTEAQQNKSLALPGTSETHLEAIEQGLAARRRCCLPGHKSNENIERMKINESYESFENIVRKENMREKKTMK